VALLALLGVALWLRASQRELAFTLSNGEPAVVGQWIGAPAADPVVLQFTDGTSVSLAPGASARVASLDESGARIVVERGMVDVAVVHRPGAHWDLDVGPFAVRVTGTRFRVSWDPTTTRLLLELREGSVLVRGPIIGDGRRVASGETLTVSIATSEMQLMTAEPRVASEVNDVAPTAAARAESPVASAASGHAAASGPNPADPAPAGPAPSWRELARAGRYREALERARVDGFDAIQERADAEELSALADTARLAGDSERAAEILLTLRRRFSGGPRAAVAAFMLGRIAFDQQKAYQRAAKWFATYLAEQPGGSYAREASGRLLEARSNAGDTKGARAAARAYLDAYPDGPHADRARSLLRR
jgi:TolA-binding protein